MIFRIHRLTLLASRVPPDVGVGILDVFIIRLRCLLLAAALSFECKRS